MGSGTARDFLPVLKPYANVTGFLAMVQWVKALGPFQPAVPNTNIQPGFIIPSTIFEACRCAFYFSVVEVQAEVINGIYSEILQEYTFSESHPYTTPTYTFNGTNFFF